MSSYQDFIVNALQSTASKDDLENEINSIDIKINNLATLDSGGNIIDGKIKDHIDNLALLDGDGNITGGKIHTTLGLKADQSEKMDTLTLD